MATVLAEDLQNRKWGMVIADESRSLRTTVARDDAQQTDAVVSLLKGAAHAVLLSGTQL